MHRADEWAYHFRHNILEEESGTREISLGPVYSQRSVSILNDISGDVELDWDR